MTKPLIVLDADTLGRQRTGDERYVANLLRELPDVADDLRFRCGHAAPGPRPGRDRADSAHGPQPDLSDERHASQAPAPPLAGARPTSSTQCRSATPDAP